MLVTFGPDVKADKLKEFSLSCISIMEIQKILLISISSVEEQIILQWSQANVSEIFDVLSVTLLLTVCTIACVVPKIFTFLLSPQVLQKENLRR